MQNERELTEILERFKQGTLQEDACALENLKSCSILLYGAGNIGKKLYSCLKENGIDVIGFLDRADTNSSNYEVPVYHPESRDIAKFKKNTHVILSALFPLNLSAEIKRQLSELGFEHVFALHEVKLNSIDCEGFYKNLFLGSYPINDMLDKDREKVLEAFSLFDTDEEREFYIQNIKAYVTRNFTGFKKPFDIALQYLAHDIPKKKNYSNFIDCGSFDGDTLRNLMQHDVGIKNYVAFEPQNKLCEKISNYIEQHKKSFESALIFPCGVYSKIDKLTFSLSTDALSVAKIDRAGNDIIQCVAIDDVLKGFHPTFIKMDIEGAEIEAVKGAKETIMKYHPQLAICVYHSLSDMWEIPLLIKSFYNGYKFYLRNYQFMGLETVLYAFPD